MVFINFEVSDSLDPKVHHSMLCYLLEHVIEKSQSSINVTSATPVKIKRYFDICFLGGSLYSSVTLTCEEEFRNLVPRHSVLIKDEGFASNVFCQLSICFPVTYHVTTFEVVSVVANIFTKHTDTRFPVRMVILRKMVVNQLFLEFYTLPFQCVNYKVMYGMERFLWKRICSKSVLVTYHHKFEVKFLADE